LATSAKTASPKGTSSVSSSQKSHVLRLPLGAINNTSRRFVAPLSADAEQAAHRYVATHESASNGELGFTVPPVRHLHMIAATTVEFTRDIKLEVVFPRAHSEGRCGEKSGYQEGDIFHIGEATDWCGNVTSQTRWPRIRGYSKLFFFALSKALSGKRDLPK
jgi:hypothetical protein